MPESQTGPDSFRHLIPEARSFLKELSGNNTRDWFAAQKSRYDSQLKTPALLLLEQFSQTIGPGTGTKLFRPHRDVRFSKDKTPYHTHLHMLWTLPDAGPLKPGFFFGVSPDYVSIGCGLMGLAKDELTTWRAEVDGRFGADLLVLLAELHSRGNRISEPELKRVPSPFDKDHPSAALLRRKSLTVWKDLDADQFDAPLSELEDAFTTFQPFLDRLRDV